MRKFVTWWVEIVEDNMKDDDELTAGDRKRRSCYFCFWDKNWCISKVCYITSEEGLLTVWCQASRVLYWIWIGSSPEFPQISFQYSKKKFKWNCFRFWVTRSITKLDFIPLSSTDCCNLSCCNLVTIEISTDSEFDDDRDLYRLL